MISAADLLTITLHTSCREVLESLAAVTLSLIVIDYVHGHYGVGRLGALPHHLAAVRLPVPSQHTKAQYSEIAAENQ